MIFLQDMFLNEFGDYVTTVTCKQRRVIEDDEDRSLKSFIIIHYNFRSFESRI